MIEFDEDVYPTDESIEAMIQDLSAMASSSSHKQRARAYFDAFVEGCFYAGGGPCEVEVRGERKRVYGFHTGGWSGAETFISAMRDSRAMVWIMYMERHDSGGHFYLDLLTEDEKIPVLTERALDETVRELRAIDGTLIGMTNIPERRRANPRYVDPPSRQWVFAILVVAMLGLITLKHFITGTP